MLGALGSHTETPVSGVPSASRRLGRAGSSGEQGLPQPRDPATAVLTRLAGLREAALGLLRTQRTQTLPLTQPEQKTGSEQEETAQKLCEATDRRRRSRAQPLTAARPGIPDVRARPPSLIPLPKLESTHHFRQ